MSKKVITLLTALLVSITSVGHGLNQALAAEESANAYLLLNVESDGEYYLSRIYPSVNMRNNAPSIEVGEEDGVITILADTINYIGDFIFKSRERGRGVASSFDYEPNSDTLVAAVKAERELLQSMDVAISIAGNAPVPVDKKLLGL
jgi:hypothetical protein